MVLARCQGEARKEDSEDHGQWIQVSFGEPQGWGVIEDIIAMFWNSDRTLGQVRVKGCRTRPIHDCSESRNHY